MKELGEDLAALLRHGGVDPDAVTSVEVLPGGVSSEVLRLAGPRDLVIKRPLAELKVGGGWRAELERSANEVKFAAILAQVAPQHALAVLAFDPDRNVFLMAAADRSARTWKERMLGGTIDPAVAATVGELLARIHTAGTEHSDVAAIEGRDYLESLRIDPFLRWLQPRHPERAGDLQRLITELEQPGTHLVHGDFSPKNILIDGVGRIHLIDHEVAHLGAAAFDVAFLSTHLFLKAYHLRAPAALQCATSFLQAYRRHGGEQESALLGPLTAALMLARVDGRSTTDYLRATDEDQVRSRSLTALAAGAGWQELHDTIERDLRS